MSEPARDALFVDVDDFACRCDDAVAARCDAIMAWALEHLSTGRGGELQVGKVTRENFLTAFVYALNWNYRAQITGIANDMWSMVTTETYDAVRDEAGQYAPLVPPTLTTAIACDDVSDGLAFTLRAYYERFGDSRPRAASDSTPTQD